MVAIALHTGVRITAWALRFLTRATVARVVVALLIVYLAIVVTVYTLWIGAMLWFVSGRFGIVRNTRRKATADRVAAAGCIAALPLYCAVHGMSLARCSAIASLASIGVVVWFNRASVVDAIKAEAAIGTRLRALTVRKQTWSTRDLAMATASWSAGIGKVPQAPPRPRTCYPIDLLS